MVRQPLVNVLCRNLRFNNRRRRFRATPQTVTKVPPTSVARFCQEYRSFVAIAVILLASKQQASSPDTLRAFFCLCLAQDVSSAFLYPSAHHGARANLIFYADFSVYLAHFSTDGFCRGDSRRESVVTGEICDRNLSDCVGRRLC